jgi:hypothetical protein
MYFARPENRSYSLFLFFIRAYFRGGFLYSGGEQLYMSNFMTVLLDTVLGLLPREGETVRTGKRGRPAFRCTFDAFLTNYAQRLPNEARALFEATPFQALALLSAKRRELTEEESVALGKTADGVFQGMRNGEPIQRESRASFNVAVIGDESFEDAAARTLEIAIAAAVLMAKGHGTVHAVNFERWAVCRAARPGSNRRSEVIPEELRRIPARYQGNFYVSDGGHKGGFLSFAVVHPDGRVERIAKEVNLPEPAAETAKERKNRLAREKRAAAKVNA